MNSFVNAISTQRTVTTNGMQAYQGTGNSCLDLFSSIGAMRGRDITPAFAAAFDENPEVALRIALFARDVRGGAGEREIFRSILLWLEQNKPSDLLRLLHKVPEIGRWDDLLIFKTKGMQTAAFKLYLEALNDGNGLAAKWMPRSGQVANRFRHFMSDTLGVTVTPKALRKALVQATNVVEQKMCAQEWGAIEFGKLPSRASMIYRKAFGRHVPEQYTKYLESLKKGTAKVNASAVYPHELVGRIKNDADSTLVEAMWEALPNYVGSASILPMVDVSGSMAQPVARGSKIQAMDVAVGLGLYLADKNRGSFKGAFLTFSSAPRLQVLKGNIKAKLSSLSNADWGMSTNIEAAFTQILKVAVKGKVPQAEMPGILLVLSDMQFNASTSGMWNDTAYENMKHQYRAAGYEAPKLVFWNLVSHDNKPATASQPGVALVSGFSPAVLKAVLSDKLEAFTPMDVMLEAVMIDRYSI